MSRGEPQALHGYVLELERAAARLRSGQASPDEAAELVERCAELAAKVSASLDDQARGVTAELPLDQSPEQERLL